MTKIRSNSLWSDVKWVNSGLIWKQLSWAVIPVTATRCQQNPVVLRSYSLTKANDVKREQFYFCIFMPSINFGNISNNPVSLQSRPSRKAQSKHQSSHSIRVLVKSSHMCAPAEACVCGGTGRSVTSPPAERYKNDQTRKLNTASPELHWKWSPERTRQAPTKLIWSNFHKNITWINSYGAETLETSFHIGQKRKKTVGWSERKSRVFLFGTFL